MTTLTKPAAHPSKTFWNLPLYKVGANWATDLKCWDIYEELLTGGSEKCLDHHYLHLMHEFPSWDAQMAALFTLTEVPGFEAATKLSYMGPSEFNPLASWYMDESLGEQWWLCPLWVQMWGGKVAPGECYLYLSSC